MSGIMPNKKKGKRKRRPVEKLEVFKTLDEGFKIFRKRYLQFIAISAIVFIPLHLLIVVASYNLTSPYAGPTGNSAVGISMISYFLTIAIGMLSSGAQMHLASREYLDEGQDVTILDSLKVVISKLLSLALASILVSLLSMLGFLFLIIPGIWIVMACSLTTAAIVIENKGPTSSISRSIKLTSGNIFRLIGAGIIIWLIQEVASIPVHFINQLVVTSYFSSLNGSLLGFLIYSKIIEILPHILVSPLATVVMAVVYFKLRDLHEGFDLERMVDKLTGDADESVSDYKKSYRDEYDNMDEEEGLDDERDNITGQESIDDENRDDNEDIDKRGDMRYYQATKFLSGTLAP